MMPPSESNSEEDLTQIHYAVFAALSQMGPSIVRDVQEKTESWLGRPVSESLIKEIFYSSREDLARSFCGLKHFDRDMSRPFAGRVARFVATQHFSRAPSTVENSVATPGSNLSHDVPLKSISMDVDEEDVIQEAHPRQLEEDRVEMQPMPEEKSNDVVERHEDTTDSDRAATESPGKEQPVSDEEGVDAVVPLEKEEEIEVEEESTVPAPLLPQPVPSEESAPKSEPLQLPASEYSDSYERVLDSEENFDEDPPRTQEDVFGERNVEEEEIQTVERETQEQGTAPAEMISYHPDDQLDSVGHNSPLTLNATSSNAVESSEQIGRGSSNFRDAYLRRIFGSPVSKNAPQSSEDETPETSPHKPISLFRGDQLDNAFARRPIAQNATFDAEESIDRNVHAPSTSQRSDLDRHAENLSQNSPEAKNPPIASTLNMPSFANRPGPFSSASRFGGVVLRNNFLSIPTANDAPDPSSLDLEKPSPSEQLTVQPGVEAAVPVGPDAIDATAEAPEPPVFTEQTASLPVGRRAPCDPDAMNTTFTAEEDAVPRQQTNISLASVPSSPQRFIDSQCFERAVSSVSNSTNMTFDVDESSSFLRRNSVVSVRTVPCHVASSSSDVLMASEQSASNLIARAADIVDSQRTKKLLAPRRSTGHKPTTPVAKQGHLANVGDEPLPWVPREIADISDSYTVRITQVTDPSDFHVAICEPGTLYDVEKALKNWWKLAKKSEFAVNADDIVEKMPVGISRSPSLVERGIVVSMLSPNSVQVHLIDRGIYEVVPVVRLCRLPKKLMYDFVALAVHCCVEVDTNKYTDDGRPLWPMKVMSSMRKAVEKKKVYQALFGEQRKGKYVVNLYIPKYGMDENMSLLHHVNKYLSLWNDGPKSPTGSVTSTASLFGASTVTELEMSVDSDGTLEPQHVSSGSDSTLSDPDLDIERV